MREALEHLPEPPDHLLIDALTIREAAYPQRAIIDGDAISASIAAASIVAKVTRDRICDEMDHRFPSYGFARHKGYGTRSHYAALVREGPCEWHRRSFAPIRMLLAGTQLPLDLEFADLPLVDEDDFEPNDS
jgi:ribonuclease HII